MATYRKNDPSILFGPQITGAKVRERIAGKYEVIPKTKEHIKVRAEQCMGCEICYIICPTGSFEMEDGKATWKYGMTTCAECGSWKCICPVHAID